MTDPRVGIDLYWLPLGAGGHFVRFNGRLYEFMMARLERRPPLDLYHTALVVTVPEGRYVIENAWPIPDGNGGSRGVTVEGPVWNETLGRLKIFRYEVRCWRDGTIADIDEAVDSPQRVGDTEDQARRVLELAQQVPVHVWGRDELGIGDMWNSNSVISWLLTKADVHADRSRAPQGGRAPGWMAGVTAAQRTTEGPAVVA